MTIKEAKDILFESLFQIPETRVDFLRQKCIEGHYSPVPYYLALSEAYEEIEMFLSEDRPIGTGQNGEPVYIKESIYFPGAIGLKNSIDRTDLLQILEPLQQFGQTIAEQISKLKPPPPARKSLTWNGSPEQLAALYEGLKVAGCIDQGTAEEAFKWIFSSDSETRQPVTWKHSNRLLAYMMNQLTVGVLIENKDWQSVIEKGQMFKNKNGKIILAGDLSTALSEMNTGNILPEGADKIDDLIKKVRQL